MTSRHKLMILIAITIVLAKPSTAELSPRIFYGTETGKMFRCFLDKEDSCEKYNVAGSAIRSMTASGEYIYAGLEGGHMWRCPLNTPHSCAIFNVGPAINAVAAASDFLYAGLQDSRIWQCSLEYYHSCKTFYEANHPIRALAVNEKYVIAVTDNGDMLSCNFEKADSCRNLNKADGTKLNAIALTDDYIYGGLANGVLWRCEYDRKHSCIIYNNAPSGILSMDIRDDYLYSGLESGDIWKCNIKAQLSCEVVMNNDENATSIVTTYRTTSLNSAFKGENKFCTWQDKSKCIPPVIYYNIQDRPVFELKIRNGKLYDSVGDLFDTTDADISISGDKAIFVMEPKGRIYASVKHPIYLIHDSSFLAGNDVAAAGELVVERGIIVSISTCSAHYIPSLELTKQVISSLRNKGYDKDVSVTECKKLKLVLDQFFNKL